jgi:two-component system chemotaxis response regulator CheB
MKATRVLIVDDSVVARKVISELLSSDPAVEVAGTAANGKIALSKVRSQRPNLVLLDVEMPVMDGLETLRELRRMEPDLPVIMFSSFTHAGARITVEALTLGAADYVAKPKNLSDAASREAVAGELIRKIKAISRAGAVMSSPNIPVSPRPRRAEEPAPGHRVDIVVVGASTGGPNAIAEVFANLPRNIPVPILLVLHMPAEFTPIYADRLTRGSRLVIREARDGTVLEPGQAWVAPGGYHMALSRKLESVRIVLNQDPPENFCRPALDVLFRSVGRVYRNRALGVIMTGMGEDGLLGAKALRDVGAQIIVQDEDSSVVWGMPGAVAKAGIADKIVPLQDIADELVRRVSAKR